MLSFFTVRLVNSGGKPITQEMFDKNLIFGLELSNGRAFPPDLVEASQKYLRENLKPSLTASNRLEFGKVVIDPAAHFTVRFLVLHFENQDPTVVLVGKIAGIPFDNEPIQTTQQSAKPSFWREVASGSPVIHLVRFAGYIFLSIISIFILALISSRFAGWNNKRTYRKFRDGFLKYQNGNECPYFEKLHSISRHQGAFGLEFIKQSGESQFTRQMLDTMRSREPHPTIYSASCGREHNAPLAHYLLKELDNEGLFEETNGVLVLKPSFLQNLTDYQTFWRVSNPNDTEKINLEVREAIKWMKAEYGRPPVNLSTKPDSPTDKTKI